MKLRIISFLLFTMGVSLMGQIRIEPAAPVFRVEKASGRRAAENTVDAKWRPTLGFVLDSNRQLKQLIGSASAPLVSEQPIENLPSDILSVANSPLGDAYLVAGPERTIWQIPSGSLEARKTDWTGALEVQTGWGVVAVRQESSFVLLRKTDAGLELQTTIRFEGLGEGVKQWSLLGAHRLLAILGEGLYELSSDQTPKRLASVSENGLLATSRNGFVVYDPAKQELQAFDAAGALQRVWASDSNGFQTPNAIGMAREGDFAYLFDSKAGGVFEVPVSSGSAKFTSYSGPMVDLAKLEESGAFYLGDRGKEAVVLASRSEGNQITFAAWSSKAPEVTESLSAGESVSRAAAESSGPQPRFASNARDFIFSPTGTAGFTGPGANCPAPAPTPVWFTTDTVVGFFFRVDSAGPTDTVAVQLRNPNNVTVFNQSSISLQTAGVRCLGFSPNIGTAPPGGTWTVIVFNNQGQTIGTATIVLAGPPSAPTNYTPTPAFVTLGQSDIRLGFTNPYPLAIRGDVAPSNAVDSTIVFPAGQATNVMDNRVLSGSPFTIPANATGTNVPTFRLQIGSAAGTLRLNIRLTEVGVGNSFRPLPSPVLAFIEHPITLAAPVLVDGRVVVEGNPNGNSLTIRIGGYTTRRRISSARFEFTARQGVTLPNPNVTVALTTQSNGWFLQTASLATGGQFNYDQTFALAGGLLNQLASVRITLIDDGRPAGQQESNTITRSLP